MPFAHGYALIIGDAARSATAQAVVGVLGDPQLCGYPSAQITLVADHSDSDALYAALDAFLQQVGTNATALVYIGGALPLNPRDMLLWLRELKAQHLLLVVDLAAASEPLPLDWQAAALATGAGRAIIGFQAAGADNTKAEAQSLFELALVAALQGATTSAHNGYIGSFDLYAAVYTSVRQAGSGQLPTLHVLLNAQPFPVALHRGATKGRFNALPIPPQGTATSLVAPQRAKQLFEALLSFATATAEPQVPASASFDGVLKPDKDMLPAPSTPKNIELLSRRFEAALPPTVYVGVKTEIRVVLALPDGEGLELPTTTASGQLIKPGDVASSETSIPSPADAAYVVVYLKLSADDFVVDEDSSDLDLRVYRTARSSQATLVLTPQRLNERSLLVLRLFKDKERTDRIDSLNLYAQIVERGAVNAATHPSLMSLTPLNGASNGNVVIQSAHITIVGGDYIDGDKLNGDKFGGDKVFGNKVASTTIP